MQLARFSLGLTAAAFGGFGMWLLFKPGALSNVGVELPTPAARAEIRAFYGGLELGMALFFAAAAARPAWFRPALVVQSASLGGAALGRIFSMRADPTDDRVIRLFTVLEGAGCTLGLAALAQVESSVPARRSSESRERRTAWTD